MSAKERAEARRKALSTKGTDRLKKLTTSARGEDAPQFAHDDPPLASLQSFVGESSPSVAPPRVAMAESNFNDWKANSADSPLLNPPWTSLLHNSGQPTPIPDVYLNPGAPTVHSNDPKPSPLAMTARRYAAGLHLITSLLLLLYFVIIFEPAGYNSHSHVLEETFTARWSRLAHRPTKLQQYNEEVQEVPLLWSFVALQIGLHAIWQYFSLELTQIHPLLQLAMPHFPSVLRDNFQQLVSFASILSSLWNNVATLIFGVGFTIWFSGKLQ